MATKNIKKGQEFEFGGEVWVVVKKCIYNSRPAYWCERKVPTAHEVKMGGGFTSLFKSDLKSLA